ncbi:IS1/IS1595 family N-terminal zinc-binding domain-containing protein [Sphingomonas zeae]
MRCPKCEGSDLIKRGRKAGHQRYVCRACGRYCTDSQPRFSAETKAMAIEMYMNSMGIRAIGRVLVHHRLRFSSGFARNMRSSSRNWHMPLRSTPGSPMSSRWTRSTPTSKKTAARGNLDGVQPPASPRRCLSCRR